MNRQQFLIAFAAAVVAFMVTTAVTPLSLGAVAVLTCVCALLYARYRRNNMDPDEGPENALGRDTRTIPQWIKVQVAARDKGKCVICGSRKDIQYDHIIPWSRGGSSKDPSNIQLLCGIHNRAKSDKLDYTV